MSPRLSPKKLSTFGHQMCHPGRVGCLAPTCADLPLHNKRNPHLAVRWAIWQGLDAWHPHVPARAMHSYATKETTLINRDPRRVDKRKGIVCKYVLTKFVLCIEIPNSYPWLKHHPHGRGCASSLCLSQAKHQAVSLNPVAYANSSLPIQQPEWSILTS